MSKLNELIVGAEESHAGDCPYRFKGECNCKRSLSCATCEPDQDEPDVDWCDVCRPDNQGGIKATATFWVSDVQDAFDVTKEEAEAWLLKRRKHIEWHMYDVGRDVIRDVGVEDGLTPKEEEA